MSNEVVNMTAELRKEEIRRDSDSYIREEDTSNGVWECLCVFVLQAAKKKIFLLWFIVAVTKKKW